VWGCLVDNDRARKPALANVKSLIRLEPGSFDLHVHVDAEPQKETPIRKMMPLTTQTTA
jgi:hypothetical protein